MKNVALHFGRIGLCAILWTGAFSLGACATSSKTTRIPEPPSVELIARLIQVPPPMIVPTVTRPEKQAIEVWKTSSFWVAEYRIRSAAAGTKLEYFNVLLLRKNHARDKRWSDYFTGEFTAPNGDQIRSKTFYNIPQGASTHTELIPRDEDWTLAVGFQTGPDRHGSSPVDIFESGPRLVQAIARALREQ